MLRLVMDGDDTWNRFSQAEQTILREVASEYTDTSVVAVHQRYTIALAAMVADGAIVTTLPPSEKQKMDRRPAAVRQTVG